MEFTYIQTTKQEEFKELFNRHLQEGWFPHGDTHVMLVSDKLTYYQGFFHAKSTAQSSMAERFALGYANLDSKLKDLLEINQINLAYDDSHFTVEHDGKTTELSPFRVVSLLVGSKHCPIDLDEQWVMNEIQRNFS